MKKVIAFISFIVLGTSAFAGNVCKVVEIGGNRFLLCELKPEGPTVPGEPDFSIPGYPTSPIYIVPGIPNKPEPTPEKPSYGPTVPGAPDFGINPPADKPEKPSYGPTVPGEPSNEAPARPVRPQNPCISFPVWWLR